MKLLFVHQNLGEFGGAEANVHLTASELQSRGHTVALLYRCGTGRNEADWQRIFKECFCLPGAGDTETAEAVLEHFAPDLIFLHNFADLEVVEALLKSGIPTIRLVHDHAMYCMRSYKYNYFSRKPCTRSFSPYCVFPCLASIARNRDGWQPLKWVSYTEKRREIELSRRCQAVVVYSDYIKQELIRNQFDPDKIHVCVPVRMDSEPEPTSSFSERNLILFAGQIIRGKGVDVLLRALAKIKVPFECIILGDGNYRAYCERLCVRLGLSGRVHFHGYVLPAELKSYYLEASVFVMSSLWPEPFGLAGLEAMRYGLPVVAFDAGGIKEWLKNGENGYLVRWKDTEQFAACVEELLRDKEFARKMGRRALEGVTHYNLAGQIDILERLFQRVLHQSRERATRNAAPKNILSAYD